MLLVQIPEHTHPNFIMIWFSQNQILILTVLLLCAFFLVSPHRISLCVLTSCFFHYPLSPLCTVYLCVPSVYMCLCALFVMHYCLKVSRRAAKFTTATKHITKQFILFSTQFLPSRLELLRIS